MKVKKLIDLLQELDPEAFVTIGLPESNPEYLSRLNDRPACLLWFYVSQESRCSYSDFPQMPLMNQVTINVSLDKTFFGTDNREMLEDIEENAIRPDFFPEAN
ncbi:hypothetical protein [Zavarzinella formosa]|uniref:hypothetical protein n=1 Tax=Zavarzinella formosa TaxID=360055 RepID=UPI0003115047|nr:hypothetical protein [Zavarzinella formosa]